jgi:hypothetical protein
LDRHFNKRTFKMKKALVFWGALAMSAGAMAADVGLGMGVGQNASTLYVPIELSPSLRLEPYVTAYKSVRKDLNSKNNSTYVGFGAGLFGVQQTGEGIRVFGGARLGYVTRKSSQTAESYDYSDRSSGVELAPTVGFEYDLHKNFSIGGEAGLAHTRLSGTSKSEAQKADVNENTTRTFTTVTIKYHFR